MGERIEPLGSARRSELGNRALQAMERQESALQDGDYDKWGRRAFAEEVHIAVMDNEVVEASE
jgi:hypothetical protein